MNERDHNHPESRDTNEAQTAHPGSSINRINIRVDANALAIVALIFSVGALVAVFMLSISIPQITDAKIAAGVAKAEATAHAADVNARVAVDEIERMRTALAAQKIVIPKSHD